MTTYPPPSTGTGDVKDAGYGEGKNYAINFPLHDGMDDDAYRTVFRPVIGKVMETFQPGAIVLQVSMCVNVYICVGGGCLAVGR